MKRYLRLNLVFLFVFTCWAFDVKGQVNITITELNYRSDSTRDAGDWVEFHNLDSVNGADISNWILSVRFVTQIFVIPAGTVIPPKGYLVMSQDTLKFKEEHPGIKNFIGPYKHSLSGSGDVLRLYDDANKLYLSLSYGDSLPWPKGADGFGRTLEIKDKFTKFLNDGTNWFDGCIGGSPGKAFSPCNEKLVVGEINYFPNPQWYAGDWFELRNNGSNAIDLSGWAFITKTDSFKYVIPSGTTLPAGQNLVLYQDADLFVKTHSRISNSVGPFKFDLRNKGDGIKLYDNNGRLFFSVVYNNKAPWPLEASGSGYTLELKENAININDGGNWFKGCIGGSPGKFYTSNCPPTEIKEIASEKGLLVYPNPARDLINVKLQSADYQGKTVSFILYDILGKSVLNKTLSDMNETNHFSIPLNEHVIQKGVYIYSIADDTEVLHSGKLMIIE